MQVRYVAIYKIHGANSLPEGAERKPLLALQAPTVTATLTTNPEPDFLHIDKSAALATQLLKGLFAPDKNGTWQERLAAEINEVKARRAKQTENGVFLIFDGETDISALAFDHRRDTEDFGICLDAISKSEIRETLRPHIQAVMTALSLSLPPNADRRVERIGDACYLVDPDDGKPIYSFSFEMGQARVSVSSPLTDSVIANTVAMAPSLAADKAMARPASLLMTSLEKTTDESQAFIAAWSALEIFVNATFKSTYEAIWFEIMEESAPASAKPVYERFKDVMSDKYRLADKLLVIASVLDPAAATADAGEFRRLKNFRDKLLHGLDTGALPTDAVQRLLLKYMRLHLRASE